MVTTADLLDLMLAISTRDFDAPIERCAEILRVAEAQGLVKRWPPTLSDKSDRPGAERKFPVSITELGARLMKDWSKA